MNPETQALHDKIDRLTILVEVLISGESLHQIGGYAYGRTSGGDAFIILYPAEEYLKHKICRVYQEDFAKLPPFIDTNVPQDAQDGNPEREKAIKQRIYKPCLPFSIATRQGKETQMGPEIRFSRTVFAPPSKPKAEWTAPPAGNGKQVEPEPEKEPAGEAEQYFAHRPKATNDWKTYYTDTAPAYGLDKIQAADILNTAKNDALKAFEMIQKEFKLVSA